ncbi:outer membrane lipoprotein-sorting protein [Marinirhabdus gelatinilytica]|uniref:Outer membrane lipoprotein-sorting protein n=1 Tax=Marinirhabdus gelatinilytica TaxID=1703343 RepID=A0A370QAA4_9FLAO|nr:outer membrane lipoprotein-sorting protein [Marinirhabdus gelatinilytica]RDK85262.1 hypothetical protein C8D94_10380 [Marinirhabdus gelatinilytica]
MKTSRHFLSVFLFLFVVSLTNAQTADEIVDNYFENTGGKENWEKLETLKFTGSLGFQGMQLPVTLIQTKSGKQLVGAEIQGQMFYQMVYDGETLWKTNQQTFEAEKNDAETTENYKLTIADFPDPFLNYKEKGYKIELMGQQMVEGTETFKIKLEKKPKMFNDIQEPNIEYYYFEKENFVPILVEKNVMIGPNTSQLGTTKLSDYREVEGIYFPFSIIEGVQGNPDAQPIVIKEIEVNPELDDSIFDFPK